MYIVETLTIEGTWVPVRAQYITYDNERDALLAASGISEYDGVKCRVRAAGWAVPGDTAILVETVTL
jgi:hypothetical protein